MNFTDAVTVAGTRRRDDGYLVADARITRTGIQTYLGSEVGKPDMGMVKVYRPGSEVFADETLKSAAHRPVTNDHPPEIVTSENWKQFAVGQTSDEITGEDRELVPVDNSAPEWTTAIDFFSMGDDVGEASEFSADGDDIPFVDFKLDNGNTRVFMAGIGYRYNLQELGHAQAYGIALTNDRADAAKRKYEQFVDGVAFLGRSKLGMTGLLNTVFVTALTAANGTGGTATWTTKTADEILKDVNDVLSVIFTASNGIEQADTILLDQDRYALIATKCLDATMTTTILEHIQRVNIYTIRTGRPLTIRAVFGLENLGAGGTHRMVAYRRTPDVVKMHIPMPHRFLQAERRLLKFEVPGIFRLGGVEVVALARCLCAGTGMGQDRGFHQLRRGDPDRRNPGGDHQCQL